MSKASAAAARLADRVTIIGQRGMKARWFEKTFANERDMERWLAAHDDVVVDRYSVPTTPTVPSTETSDAR